MRTIFIMMGMWAASASAGCSLATTSSSSADLERSLEVNLHEIRTSVAHAEIESNCAFVLPDSPGDMLSHLQSVALEDVLYSQYEVVAGEAGGLDLIITTDDERKISLSMSLNGGACERFEAYWLVP